MTPFFQTKCGILEPKLGAVNEAVVLIIVYLLVEKDGSPWNVMYIVS